MKTPNWKPGLLVTLKADQGVYFLAELSRSPILVVYRVVSQNGEWLSTTLTPSQVLFFVFVGNEVLQRLGVSIVAADRVAPLHLPVPRLWLRPRLNFSGGPAFKGADLVELDPDAFTGVASAKVVLKNIPASDPRVARCESVGMWGADDLQQRLQHFARTGHDVNLPKQQLFGV